jgi:hypothetical protein
MSSDAPQQIDSGQTPTIYLILKVSNFDYPLRDSGEGMLICLSPASGILLVTAGEPSRYNAYSEF